MKVSTAHRPDEGASAESARMAAAAGLIYVSDEDPGFRRVRAGKRFRYMGSNNRLLTADLHLRRIAQLAIPPAYEKVWICKKARGHIQATARDARGRKQYRYHDAWRQFRDHVKFHRMVAFGRALPALRNRVKADLAAPGLTRDKVVAAVVRLLDTTRARVGNSEYARDNKSFGLSTLHKQHVSLLTRGRVELRFRGKGGVQHVIPLQGKRVPSIVAACRKLPGKRLFQYVGDDGHARSVTSQAVNDYLMAAMGSSFTAKDFRTWGATQQAIRLLLQTPLPEQASERALKRIIVDVVKQVAEHLRNTPAVCRKSYINPAVFDAWRSGTFVASSPRAPTIGSLDRITLRVLERLPSSRAGRSSRGRSRKSAGARAPAR